ncbi:MAG: GAF domain-containing protein, partial [Terriglobia bacterium]
ELQPVFETLLENATRLCAAKFGNLYLYDGDAFRTTAMHNVPSAFAEARRRDPIIHPEPGSLLQRVRDTNATVHVEDATKEPAYLNRQPRYVSAVELGGFRSILAVPMLKDGNLVGVIIVYRKEVSRFSDKHVDLVQNFAAQAVIAIENARLLNELRESLDQQTATSNVLGVISSSQGELDPVFDSILENAVRICGARFGNLALYDGTTMRLATTFNAPEEFARGRPKGTIIPLDISPLGTVVQTKQKLHVADLAAEEQYSRSYLVTLAGARSMLAVPMLKEGELVGVINIYRQEVRLFDDKQVALLENFAAQAVIAIENARLLSELRESLEQQTATSEVLEVISSSPGELQPVFEAMLENATRICGAKLGNLFLRESEGYRCVAVHGEARYVEDYRRSPFVPLADNAETPLGLLTKSGKFVHIADMRETRGFAEGNVRVVALVNTAGARTLVLVPMTKDDEIVGAIAIYRQEVKPFTDKQVELVANFAAQAVIAIENTRLLSELRESLEQQTATSDVLKVISSSPGSLEPVFDAMLENAVRICHAHFGVMHRFVGDEFDAVAMMNIPPALEEFLRRRGLAKAVPGTDMDNLSRSKQVVHTRDMLVSSSQAPPAKLGGARTQLAVPMMKDDELIGAIVIYRQEVMPFADKQIELVKNFASQAVIAIENARLLNELRERTDELT